MNNIPLPYSVIVDTIYGKMHLNRHDINQTEALFKRGVAIDADKIQVAVQLCQFAPTNAVILDIGANFGTYALACGRALAEKEGKIHAYEGQRIISYMLASSVALNALENVFVHNVCVGNAEELIALPRFAYDQPMNFGSVEFGSVQKEALHQDRRVSVEQVKQIRIDDQNLDNVFMIKIDVEGMEEAVLEGAIRTIDRYLPIVFIEYMKSDAQALADFFIQRGYTVYNFDGDFLCIPPDREITVNLEKYVPGMPLFSLL